MHYFAGLFLALASIPGYTSVSIPAGWAAMSMILPASLWREAKLSSLHLLLITFLTYATLSILWSPSAWDGGYRLWQLALIALAFHYGYSLSDIRSFVLGLAIGCGFSSMLSVAQWYGVQPVLFFSTSAQAGLFYNALFQGMALALVAIACLCLRLWPAIPFLLPGIYLSQSRGAWIALALGAASWLFPSPRLLAIVILCAVLAFTLSTAPSDVERMYIWQAALSRLAWFGNGSGSFISLWLLTPIDGLRHPDSVHNDALQLIFEFGLGAAPFFAVVAKALYRSSHPLWPVLAAFTFLSFFSFPLFTPICACLFALCAGRSLASGGWAWVSLSDSGRIQLPLTLAQRLRWRSIRSEALPLQPRT